MKKLLFFSLLSFFVASLFGQQDETLFGGTKLAQTGSWAGFSYTPTKFLGKSSVQTGIDVKLEYNNSVFFGWQWRKTADELFIQDANTTNQVDFGYHTFLGGYSFRTHKVVHPIFSVGVGRGKLQFDEGKDRVLVVQPSAGVEINLFRWMRLGIDGGYRYVTGIQQDNIASEDLSNYYGSVTFRFGWAWGR